MVFYSSTGSDAISSLVDRLSNMSPSLRPFPTKRRSIPCPRVWSRSSAAHDFAALVSVVGACGFLLFPYAKIIGLRSVGIICTVGAAIGEEFREAPLVCASMGISVLCAGLATLALVSGSFTGRKCSNPDCRGLRKSVEFDIQLETEEDSRKEGYPRGRNLFELPMYQHKEMEAELKRIAPPNGKAVLVFWGKCGCPIGRFEVPGPKKPPLRKTKR